MELKSAIEELKQNININLSHAVLLRDASGYYTELHTGFADNCCCCSHNDFIWREEGGFTHDNEIQMLVADLRAGRLP